jgi:hypothetical protein
VADAWVLGVDPRAVRGVGAEDAFVHLLAGGARGSPASRGVAEERERAAADGRVPVSRSPEYAGCDVVASYSCGRSLTMAVRSIVIRGRRRAGRVDLDDRPWW